MSAVGVGVIGCGVISDTYLSNLASYPDIDVVIVGDRTVERAQVKAEAHGISQWGNPEDVLAHPDVAIVVNLTVPAAHIEISSRAIAAGKHVWSEKPIGLNRRSVDELLHAADDAGVRVGCAPDTVLGPGFRAARRAIDQGVIGTPLFAGATFQTQGPDVWHPSPEFLFARGGGPLLDMGPYYFSALVGILGPVDRVAAAGMIAREERVVRSGSRAGATFAVEVPTTFHVLSVFESGAHGQSLFSFDSALERRGVVEIHGTDGSIRLPDPNTFDGSSAYLKPLKSFRDGDTFDQHWMEIPAIGTPAGRGVGLVDMARAIVEGRPHIASGEVARHVLDILLSAEESARTGAFVSLESRMPRVPTVSLDFDPFARTI
ncbi:Gfo/Idh/MocA family protein [Microbacterium sp. T32]|uniref:Gfo/Idh/MocA family protein n=1 Tax=Microbacterium sp. T32 TaxID=1776083 RepID=UPI0007AC2AA3|nr:Gfo/Idh/MocA family oxidoreductase [Microbacterium sp. T32]KZE42420.1 oxidoreductase [Microbacterium sp. T32]